MWFVSDIELKIRAKIVECQPLFTFLGVEGAIDFDFDQVLPKTWKHLQELAVEFESDESEVSKPVKEPTRL